MKWLLIINNAVFSECFKYVAQELKEKGDEVIIVTDSEYTNDKLKLQDIGCDIRIFTKWVKDNNNNTSDVLPNSWAVHSDFDRNNYYHYMSDAKYKNFWQIINSNLYSFYDNIFKSENVDFIVYENVSNGMAAMAEKVGKHYNARYLGITSSRLPGHIIFSSTDDILSECIEQAVTKGKGTENENYINDYVSNIINIVPDYMKTNGLSSANFLPKVFKRRKKNNLLTTLKYSISPELFSFQMGNPLLKSFYSNMREIKRFITSKLIKKLYSNVDKGCEYYIYPLHYHPESSTSILARYYDEFNVIKNIAFSLPSNSYLYVKDHISAFGYESFSFYKKIALLPNVKLISPDQNAKEMIRDCRGVFTLTSTVGYEAIILNKPVVVFGDVFYQRHPLVYKIKGFSDIPESISFMEMNGSVNFDDYTRSFLCAYKHLSIPFNLNYSGDSAVLKSKASDIVNAILSSQEYIRAKE
ncbi:TPA: hypothetical protein ACSTLY_003723 [Serratia fonticola]